MEDMVKENFWINKRVLVTGHTGFKGSWLSFWLTSMGANVYGLSLNPPTNPNLFDILKLDNLLDSTIGDIRDLNLVKKTVQRTKPEFIFHLAAQSIVNESYLNPIETYETNVMGTLNLLDTARHADNLKVFINVTSDKCYENNENLKKKFSELDPMGGYDPYSNSKGCSELITSAYRSSFLSKNDTNKNNVAVASARSGNVIGGGDWAPNRLLPDFIRSLNSKKFSIRNPSFIRPWQHVLEPISGYLILAQKLHLDGAKYAGAWNFGPSEDSLRNVEWIAKKLIQHWQDIKILMIEDNNESFYEASLLMLDSSKAREQLKWQSVWDTDEAIRMTCDWYKSYFFKSNMREITLFQIKKYNNN